MPLDIGAGLLLGIFINHVSGMGYIACLFVGVVACLFPDLDFVWDIFKHKSLPDGSHRDGLHYPLIFTPAVMLIGLLFNPFVALTLGIGAILHFLHDSIGLGWGVKWLYPVRKNAYAFLYYAGLPTNKDLPKKLFYSYSDAERLTLEKQFGDPEWVKHIYFQLHPFGIFEYFVLVVGVAAALNH